MSAAQSEQSQLEAEIAEAEVEIPALRARADELQLIVRERAARLYVRSATPRLDAVVNTDNVVNAARAAHLTEAIDGHDQALATELHDTARRLEERQVQLRAQRGDLEQLINSLMPLEDLLQKRLEHATTAYDKVKAARRGARRAGRCRHRCVGVPRPGRRGVHGRLRRAA